MRTETFKRRGNPPPLPALLLITILAALLLLLIKIEKQYGFIHSLREGISRVSSLPEQCYSAHMSKDLTPRQKNLIQLMPRVESGELTMQDAMKKAGYADSTARQQQEVLGCLRTNTKMQEALQKAGFTEEYLAEGVVEGTTAIEGKERIVETAEGEVHVGKPDYRTRALYYKLGAELLDAFPAKKQIEAQVGIDALIKQQEGTDESPSE